MNSASGWEVGESFTEQIVGMNWGPCQSKAWDMKKRSNFWFVLRIQWVMTCKTLKIVPALQCKF